MDDSFLHSVISDLQGRSQKLSQFVIILPNKRPKLFIQKIISSKISKPCLSPQIISIDEFFKSNSSLRLEDSLQIIIRIFKIYQSINKTSESFDDFYFWGEMIAADFDDVDKYLVSASDLFANVRDIKEIDSLYSYLSEDQVKAIQMFWSGFDPELKSKHQQMFLELWQVLDTLYVQLKQQLLHEGHAYEGMIFREVSENLVQENIISDNKTYVFVGFNALNACEEKLFNYIHKKKQALFYWDFDHTYYNDPIHEAGFFLRKYLPLFPNAITMKPSGDKKKISVFASPGFIQQIKYLKESLIKDFNSGNIIETAIVLADENLLLPVIYSLPQEIDSVNVSMGYPISNSGVYSLIEAICDLENPKYLLKNTLTNLVAIHFVTDVFGCECDEIKTYLLGSSNRYITAREIPKNELSELLFEKCNAPLQYVLKLQKILKVLCVKGKGFYNAIDLELFVKVYAVLQSIYDSVNKSKLEINNITTLTPILKKHLSSISVAFTGEPLKGLQIVGMLETRALDFKNLVILSLNEGIFPKGKAAPSFIPYNLRQGFGLPTIKHQDSIFSYYFYRLLNRAENVKLFYSEQISEQSKGEKSRLISQLQFSDRYILDEKKIQVNISSKQANVIVIPKTPEVYGKLLSDFSKRALSPSAISKYIECPLKFYFSYCAEIKEPDVVVDLPGDMEFGLIYHESLQEVYKPFEGKLISKDVLSGILNDTASLDNIITAAIKKTLHLNRKDPIEGYNKMIFKMIKKYVVNSLNIDLLDTSFVIKGLEKKIVAELKINDASVLLGGYVDRLDLKNDALRIIDYKTGKEKNEAKSVTSLFSDNPSERNAAILQILIYAYVLKCFGENEEHILPYLYYIRSQFEQKHKNIIIAKNELNSYADISSEFELELTEKLNELFDKTVAFKQTEQIENCKYCKYALICDK